MGSLGHSSFSSSPNSTRPPAATPLYNKVNIPFEGQSQSRPSTYSEGFAEPRLPSQRGETSPTDMGRPESLPSHRLKPTWQGFVGTSEDALKVFEATLSDKLHIVKRRPRDGEKADIIASGNVFVYDEDDSGIKRWTDGKDWSPSRIRGNFLLYREVSEPFRSNGRKLNTNKRSRTQSHDSAVDGLVSPISAEGSLNPSQRLSNQDVTGTRREQEMSLYGSLTDSYSFKADGLMKKTMSIAYRKKKFHLVAYYHPDEVAASRLRNVEDDAAVRDCRPRREFYENQNFRAPLDSEYHMDPMAMTGQIGPDGSYLPQMHHHFTDSYAPSHAWPQQYQPIQAQYSQHQTTSSYHVPSMYLATTPYARPQSSRIPNPVPTSYGQPLQPMPPAHTPMTPISPMSQGFVQTPQSMPPTPQSLSPTAQTQSYGLLQQSMQPYQQVHQNAGLQRHPTLHQQTSPPLQQQTSMSQSPSQQWTAYQENNVGNFQSWPYQPQSQ